MNKTSIYGLLGLAGVLIMGQPVFAAKIEFSQNKTMIKEIEFKADFYYVTLGYYINERLFAYGSLSQLESVDLGALIDRINPPADTVYLAINIRTTVDLPTFGVSYNLNDRITFKGQVLLVDISHEWSGANDDVVFNRFDNFLNRYALAVSAFF